jgi:antitoxin CptB
MSDRIDKQRLDRLRWRSRRGLLELELLLAPFVEGELHRMPGCLIDQYEDLLRYDDVDVHEWLLGRGETPAQVADIVAKIRAANGP